MKKVLLALTFAASVVSVKAQVGIGTNTPKATLDITAVNTTGTTTTAEGIIIPRVDRERAQSMQNVEKSTMIYINGATTGTQAGTAINIDSDGFYYFNGTVWIKLPDAIQTLEESYWKAQGSATSPKNGDISNKSGTSPVLVDVDIYQKGKVGIGYESSYGINFEVNKTPKQLEVGGDFRTSYHYQDENDSKKNSFFGFETNSIALADSYATRGNILYNAVSRNFEDYSFFDKPYDGSMLVQSKDELMYLSRTGLSTEANGASSHEIQNSSKYSFETISNYKNGIKASQKEKNFNENEFSVYNELDLNAQFGLDFTKGKFYLGDKYSSGEGYYFPNVKGKTNQILQLNATNELEWVDGGSSSASPKFFYMPSIVLPTTAAGVTDYVTYDSANSTFSVDLYAIYKAQFDAPIKSSNGASTGLAGFVLSRDKYEYHIIYADKTVFPHADIVFSTTTGEEGKFTYKVDPNAIVRNGSFMNIVLKVK